ncbi:hypothetical protein Mal64_31640 [Pseudobythopirellula maris]|uniref:DUF998 domain-containing protein n=1 Tax=Pseudobythopirellula maris TaxID=2527991 RepID=A0A5C5ZJU5_9BACT|nr:hypothetical protein [Pseudobythopirellula maris]TWT87622.1 hypothetical protein Mal64_31640 [Pseudobythopirellula maris]
MPLPRRDEVHPSDHATRALLVSYQTVRRAIGMTGLLLPLALWPLGWLLFGVEVQDNMSGYYHTPMRDVFVGALSAIGVFLFCYEGNDWVEDWTANLGCVSAIGVALLPLDEGKDPLDHQSLVGYAHMAFGAMFFLTLAFYSLYHFPSWKWKAHEEAPHEDERNLVYWASGLAILGSMAAMGVYLVLPASLKAPFNRYNFMFWMEWVAVWAFAAAWLTKGRAIVADLAVEVLALPTEALKRRVRRH